MFAVKLTGCCLFQTTVHFFLLLLLFSTAYRRQKGTTVQQTGEREDCSTRLQSHTCAFYWRQSDCKIHLYWLQLNSPSFYLSTGAMNEGWDVASLQIRTHKLLLPHGLIQQKGGDSIASHSGATLTAAVSPDSWGLQAHSYPAITCVFKAPVVWPFLNNIIRFIAPVPCITSKSDLHTNKAYLCKMRVWGLFYQFCFETYYM